MNDRTARIWPGLIMHPTTTTAAYGPGRPRTDGATGSGCLCVCARGSAKDLIGTTAIAVAVVLGAWRSRPRLSSSEENGTTSLEGCD